MSQRKRQKPSVTKFEQLSNEIILMCFDYFDFYHLCESFSGLNQRLSRLIENEAKIYVDLESFSLENFLTFCMNLNQLSKNNPVSLTTYKAEILNIILSDNLFHGRFSHLKSLRVAHMKSDTLNNVIFNKETKLCQTLERLSLFYEIDRKRYESIEFLNRILSSEMSSLKYLKLNWKPLSCTCDRCFHESEDRIDLCFFHLTEKNSFSCLEILIIGNDPDDYEGVNELTKISFNTLTKELLPLLPKLKCLKLDGIHFNEYNYEENRSHFVHGFTLTAKKELNFSKNLRSIYIWTIERRYGQNRIEENIKKLREFFLKNELLRSTNIKKFFIDNENMLQE